MGRRTPGRRDRGSPRRTRGDRAPPKNANAFEGLFRGAVTRSRSPVHTRVSELRITSFVRLRGETSHFCDERDGAAETKSSYRGKPTPRRVSDSTVSRVGPPTA